MKTCIQDNKIILFIKKHHLEKIDFNNKKDLEKYFRKLFSILKENYDIKLNGYYTIDVYRDNYYGAVIELEKEDLEYYDYFDNQIDMRINNHGNVKILYLIEDYFDLDEEILKKSKIYLYKKHLYLDLINNLNNRLYAKLLEHSKLIYNKEQILKKATIIERS